MMIYENPRIDIVGLDASDLIATSLGGGSNETVPGGSDLPVIDANEDGQSTGYTGN